MYPLVVETSNKRAIQVQGRTSARSLEMNCPHCGSERLDLYLGGPRNGVVVCGACSFEFKLGTESGSSIDPSLVGFSVGGHD